MSPFNTSNSRKAFQNKDIQRPSYLPCLRHVANSAQKQDSYLMPPTNSTLAVADAYAAFAMRCIQVLSAKQ